VLEIREKECTSSKKEIPGSPAVDFLTGIGECGYFTAWDRKATGFVVVDRMAVDHGFTDTDGLLESYTQSDFDDRRTDFQRKLRLPQNTRIVYQGDTVRFYPQKGSFEDLEVVEITEDLENISMTLGQKDKGYADAWRIKESASDGYTDKYIDESFEASTQAAIYFPTDPTHLAPDFEVMFKVPKGSIKKENRHRVTLSTTCSYASDQPKNVEDPDLGRCYVKVWSASAADPHHHIFPGVNPVVGGIPMLDIIQSTG
jgi:hypothetical protein